MSWRDYHWLARCNPEITSIRLSTQSLLIWRFIPSSHFAKAPWLSNTNSLLDWSNLIFIGLSYWCSDSLAIIDNSKTRHLLTYTYAFLVKLALCYVDVCIAFCEGQTTIRDSIYCMMLQRLIYALEDRAWSILWSFRGLVATCWFWVLICIRLLRIGLRILKKWCWDIFVNDTRVRRLLIPTKIQLTIILLEAAFWRWGGHRISYFCNSSIVIFWRLTWMLIHILT